MAVITYEIDPGGDMYLVLRDPNSQNIVPIINKEKEDSNDTFNNPIFSGRYIVFNAEEDDSDDQARFGDVAVEVHFLVSSRHLILASRTFRKMLEGGWSESSFAPAQSGRRQIQTSGWDAAALAIVLDAIHGRYRELPKYMNLGLLTRIATIIDYYEFHETLQPISDFWVATLRASCQVPTNYCQSTFMWLYISWVFSEKEVASPISKMFLEQSDGFSKVDSFDLPVGGIIAIIEYKRCEIIGRIVTGLEEVCETLTKETGCHGGDPNCSAIMLGILIREQHKLKLPDSPLAAPYSGYSVSSLKARMAKFPESKPEKRIREPYRSYSGHYNSSSYHENPCSCTIALRLKDLFKEIENLLKGFDLTAQE